MNGPFSITSAQRYLRCPWAWWMRYRSGEEGPPRHTQPERMRIGSAVHVALAAAFEARKAEPSPTPTDRMGEYNQQARQALQEAWGAEGLTEAGGSYDRALGGLLATLDALPAPMPPDILGVELRLEPTSPDGLNLVMILDLALVEAPGVARVIDWKIRSRKATLQELTLDLQLDAYAYALQTTYPGFARVLIGHYYPPIQRGVHTTASQEWIKGAIGQLEAIAEMIDTDTTFDPIVSQACEECPWRAAHCPAWPPKEDP